MAGQANEGGSTAADETVGRTIGGRFRIDAVIGEGAMGAVYRAHHLGLRKDVAVKLLHRELTAHDEIVARFDREAAAASRLDHINCVRVLDFGSTDDGRSYLVMELLDGQELAAIVGAPLPPDRAIEILEQVLRGLAHAHAHGLVHRDVKPENIFLANGATGEVAKLLDFGLAKIQEGQGAAVAPLTRAGAVFGTPSYMSPEQCAGKSIDQRTDIYSAGIVMYEMLTGDRPFHSDDGPTEILRGHIMGTPPPIPPSIPKPLRDFVMRMIEKKPEDRFATATSAIAALDVAKRQTAPEPDGPPTRRGVVLPPPAPGMARPKAPHAGPSGPSAGIPPAPTVPPRAVSAPAAPAPPNATVRAPSPGARAEGAIEAPPPASAPGQGSSAAPPPIVAAAAMAPPAPPPIQSPVAPPPQAPAVARVAAPGARAQQARAILDDVVARGRAQLKQRPWLKPALVAAGVLVLVAVVAWPGGDDGDAPAEDTDAAAEVAAADHDDPATQAAESDGASKADDEIAIDAEGGDSAGEGPTKADRALRANLASIDALIESKSYDSARITLGPLLEVYEDEPGLHWRMGKVLLRLNPKANGAAALESYRNALSLDSALLDDPAFADEFWPLLDQPKHRAVATEIAIDLLGDAGHERIAKWINVQTSPLPHGTRHRAIDHLTEAGKAATINVPLQVALDLWQAQATDTPCEVFAGALTAARENPDSFLWGSIVDAPTPTVSEGTECPGVAESRDALATQYAERYAGLGRAVPAAYAKKRRRSK